MDGDLTPFKHGSEGTHMCCNRRLREMGDKATCCVCDPHLPCDLRPGVGVKKQDTKVKKYKRAKLF